MEPKTYGLQELTAEIVNVNEKVSHMLTKF